MWCGFWVVKQRNRGNIFKYSSPWGGLNLCSPPVELTTRKKKTVSSLVEKANSPNILTTHSASFDIKTTPVNDTNSQSHLTNKSSTLSSLNPIKKSKKQLNILKCFPADFSGLFHVSVSYKNKNNVGTLFHIVNLGRVFSKQLITFPSNSKLI